MPEPGRPKARSRTLAAYGVLLVALVLVGAALLWINRDQTPAYLSARPEDLAWFQDARFGLMITWGPVSLTGEEISWSRRGPRRGEDKSWQDSGSIPAEEYDQLYRSFNPTRFNAAEMVRLARQAGARYLVFVTKHHDGFCMFDSALTDHKITRSPVGRDLTAEIADACRGAGMRLGFYYSQVDWHHSDYRTQRHGRYIEYLHGQMRELCSRYGRVDLVWFDGLFWRVQDWDSHGLFKLIRGLQPGVLINDRAALPGDFHTLETERKVGEYSEQGVWETCMPLGEQWSYRPGDQLKSTAECIRYLVRCAGSGGNFLLNVSPDAHGTIPPDQADRLRGIGAWLAEHGTSIYETRPGPLRPGDWGVSTRRGKTVYLHLLGASAPVFLPAIDGYITSAATLKGLPVPFAQSGEGIRIDLPPEAISETDTVIQLQLATEIR